MHASAILSQPRLRKTSSSTPRAPSAICGVRRAAAQPQTGCGSRPSPSNLRSKDPKERNEKDNMKGGEREGTPQDGQARHALPLTATTTPVLPNSIVQATDAGSICRRSGAALTFGLMIIPSFRCDSRRAHAMDLGMRFTERRNLF
jgi:hypothetical protein